MHPPVILAQSLGEYGGISGAMAPLARAVQSGVQWVQLSLREDSPVWIAAGVGLLIVLWLFRRR